MSDEQPTYALERVRLLASSPATRIITGTATQGAGELGLDEAAIVACVQGLESGCFYKTMPSERRPELWQDVYRPVFEGLQLYVKVQIVEEQPNEKLVVISFKRR